MLDPSSSEDDSELEGERPPPDAVLLAPSTDLSLAPPAAVREPRGPGEGGPAVGGRCSPSPSVRSEGREEQERLQREERERRGRLQLYVFIIRCIAHPFNAKQPTDMARRQQKPDEQTDMFWRDTA